MKKIFTALQTCPLFADINSADLDKLLACLLAKQHSYGKGGYVFRAGDRVESVGIVLTGGVHILQEDFWGNSAILSHIGPGGLFGEAFSCAGTELLPVSVSAVEPSEILLINYRKIITLCPNSCTFHSGLIGNMLRILAQKNVLLTRKMEVLSMRSIREKLLSYFSGLAVTCRSNAFSIPFNRQELADYLCVERSALSRELGKMRDEGILRFDRNHFELME